MEIRVLEVLKADGEIPKWKVFLKEAVITAREVFLKIGRTLVVMMTAVDWWKSAEK